MKRCQTPTFIHELELIEPKEGGFRQVDLVEVHSKKLYNSLLGKLKKKVIFVKSSLEWKEARKLSRGSVKRAEAFRAILIREGLTEHHVDSYMKDLRMGEFEDFVGSHVAQKVGSRVWQAIEKLIHAKAKRVRFKKRGEFFSFEGKDNRSFLRFMNPKDELPFILLRKVRYDFKWDADCPYQNHALSSRCKFVRIVKKRIQGRIRYFAQLICEGTPFKDLEKMNRHEQKMKSFLGEDSFIPAQNIEPKYQKVVCIDFGPKNIAVSTATCSFERSIAPGLVDQTKEIRKLQRAMDRSLRSMNPENFHPNGTVVKGKKKWIKSKSYIQLQEEKANLQRKQASHRKSIQGDLANDILTLGNIIKLEKVSYLGFQKVYGKSVGLHAPSSLQDMLTRKAENARGRVELINTFETKLSQTCLCGGQKKKPLHIRVHRCESCLFGSQNHSVSRDTFSAFLGVFTDNTDTKKGRVTHYSSSLNLKQANLAIEGHRVLTLAGLEKLKKQVQTSEGYPSDGVEKSALEDSARTASSLFLESNDLQTSLESGNSWTQKNLHP